MLNVYLKRYNKLLFYSVCAWMVLFFTACEKEESKQVSHQPHDINQPIVVTDFYPTAGGAKDKILLNGSNFGTDASQIEVYFNHAKAAVVSSSGDRIYAIVPRLPGANPVIKVVVGERSVTYDGTFDYTPQAQVTTVTGN